MPSFSSPSLIRVASQDHTLRLKITHNLVHGSPSDVVYNVKGRLPKDLDVLWLSDLTISLDGSLDGHRISAHDMARSGLVCHLQAQLKANADRLGLNNVSHPFVDDVDGLSKLTVTPSRPLPRVSRPHADLVSLHLDYIWRSTPGRSDTVDSTQYLVEKVDPFSPTLFLPMETLLKRVIEQFLIYHLVGRYPLIFGPWCKRFDLEMQYIPSIGHSIVDMMTRSKNPRFLFKCKRLLKIARRDHKYVLETCTAALSACTHDVTAETFVQEIDDPLGTPALTDEQVLCEAMAQLFRVGAPQRRFKPAVTPQFLSLPQDDDDGLLSCIPDAGRDGEVHGVELDLHAVFPRAPAADFDQTLLEDMDVFVQDWPEVETRSNESLIGASVPSASVVSPLDCLDIDYCEPAPAANGSRWTPPQEDPETPALFANLTHSGSHGPVDHHYSQKCGQVMQGLGTCQVGSESFETLDSCSERDEADDADSILLGLYEETGTNPDGADRWVLEDDLDWDDPH